MKIIARDNYDRDTVDDKLIAEHVPERYTNIIVEALNKRFGGERSPDYFVAVDDDYVLSKWEP